MTKKIYVLCPAFYKTGGTELLHQFVWALNQKGHDARIAYYGKKEEGYLNPAFEKYVREYALYNTVKNEDAYFVVPEVFTSALKTELNPKKCVIWWESVDNYNKTLKQEIRYNGILRAGYHTLRKMLHSNKAGFGILKQVKHHFVQSYYAKDYLKQHGIVGNVSFLKDYINSLYVEKEPCVDLSKKENIVLYNPGKGRIVTEKILKKNPDLKFVPLKGMTNDQVQETLAKAKVYIDFGNHPGMDRFPREAALMHCCVITNKCGSAKYYEDVPIKEKYKFGGNQPDFKLLRKTIDDCFANYQKSDRDFDCYRDFIVSQYDEFINDAESAYRMIQKED